MGRRAGAAAAQTGLGSGTWEPFESASPPALAARTHYASSITAPTPRRAASSVPELSPAPGSRPEPPASRYASTQLDPRPAAAARARRLTRDCLTRWNLPRLTDDAEAIAAEITANAVAAVPPGSTGLTLIYAIHATPGQVRLCTWDIGPGHPAPADAGPDAETGRGLAIIHALTQGNWGWWPTPQSGGKVVWAALTASPHNGPA